MKNAVVAALCSSRRLPQARICTGVTTPRASRRPRRGAVTAWVSGTPTGAGPMIATVSSIAAALAPKPSRAPRRSATRASATPPASAIQNPPVGAARAARNDTTATCAGPAGAGGASVGIPASLRNMPGTIERFPLFPLDLVLLPQELVPLHIFEERYKLMIGECLDEEREFGILWLSDDGLKEVGCSARITRVLERFDDGRLNILIEGSEPFRLMRRIEDLPYPAGVKRTVSTLVRLLQLQRERASGPPSTVIRLGRKRRRSEPSAARSV